MSATVAKPDLLYRAGALAFSSLDEGRRRATFVAATENAVPMRRGPEVLRMEGLDLKRYLSNPVVLDTHRMESIDDVLGRVVEHEVDGARLLVTIEFDEEGKADRAWNKVRKGSLRALSVGYSVDPSSVTYDERTGVYEVGSWRLYEISVTPVGADEHALRRSFFANHHQEGRMADPSPAAPPAPQPTIQPPAAAPARAERSLEEHTPAEIAARDAEADAKRARAAEDLRIHQIRAMTPEFLGDVADELVIEGVSLADARKRLLAAYRERSKPGVTPEPTPAPAAAPRESTPTTNPQAAEAALRAFLGAKE